MDESVFCMAENINELHRRAYAVYLPVVKNICSREVSEGELEHILDHLLDFTCEKKMLDLYKKVCRKYLCIYQNCIKFYIEAYRETWEEEKEYL